MQKATTYPMGSRRAHRRGFTLTEIAIVLGIVGLILGAIWVAAAAVYNNLRVSHTNTAVLQMVQAVRTLHATQAAITLGDDTAAMIAAGVVPSDMLNGVGGLTDAWGGRAFVGGTTDTQGIVIQLNGVPQAQCIDLIPQIAGSTRDAGLFLARPIAAAGALGTNYTAVAATGPAIAAVAPTAAATGCANPLNDVQFGFLLKG